MTPLNLKESPSIPENPIYIAGWLLAFAGTIATFFFTKTLGGLKIVEDITILFFYLMIFIINNSILVPRLLYQWKFPVYLISVTLLVSSIMYLSFLVILNFHQYEPLQNFLHDFIYAIKSHDIIDAGEIVDKESTANVEKIFVLPPSRIVSHPVTFFIYHGIVSVLMVGFNTAIKLSDKWLKEEFHRRRIEEERFKTEMAFLKSQVSPHFLMNTLNNIHALINEDKEEARTAVISLSKLLRHQLYDLDSGRTTLKKEIDFMESYVGLTRLRYTDGVEINTNFPEEINDIELPPMLFVVFLENSFKHGISYKSKSYVDIKLKQNKDSLQFDIKNSLPIIPRSMNGEGSGIGLVNVKKRLELLYGDKYRLDINKTENEYYVKLIVPTHEN